MKYKILLFLGLSSYLFGNELTLSKAYELYLINEPKLKAKQFKISAKEEEQEQLFSKLYPQIQGSFSSGYYQYSAEYLKNKKVEENYIDYSISATQAIYHPEYLKEISQSKSKITSAKYEYQWESQITGLDVLILYFNILKETEKRELIISQQKYYEEKYKEIEDMLKIGLSNKIDLINTKIEKDKINIELADSNRKIKISKLKLESLIGEDIENLKNINFLHLDISKFKVNKKEIEEKIKESPYLKAAAINIKVAKDEVDINKYEYYPKIDLSISRKQSNSSDAYIHNYDNQAVIKMTIPIYQGGYSNSKNRESELLLLSSKKEEEFKKKEIKIKFEEACEERDFLIKNLENLKEALSLSETNLIYIEKAQKVGMKTILDVLEENAKVSKIKKEITEVGFDLIKNNLFLLNLSGELTIENIISYEDKLES